MLYTINLFRKTLYQSQYALKYLNFVIHHFSPNFILEHQIHEKDGLLRISLVVFYYLSGLFILIDFYQIL